MINFRLSEIPPVFKVLQYLSSVATPMEQFRGADHELTDQIVVWETAISSIIIFLAPFILKRVEVFG